MSRPSASCLANSTAAPSFAQSRVKKLRPALTEGSVGGLFVQGLVSLIRPGPVSTCLQGEHVSKRRAAHIRPDHQRQKPEVPGNDPRKRRRVKRPQKITLAELRR